MSRASFSLGRAIALGPHRCFVLVDNEVFQANARDLVQKARPEVLLILTHGGPTPRWLQPLSALNRAAPTLLAHNRLPRRSAAWENTLRGWNTTRITSDRIVTIDRHVPTALHGAATLSVGN
jgi:hypothetical protein